MKLVVMLKWSEGDDKWHVLTPDTGKFIYDLYDCENMNRIFDRPDKSKKEMYTLDIHRFNQKEKLTMQNHDCKQEETIGKIKEFIGNMKGMKAMLGTIVVAIAVQVGTFLFLWGSLTTTVNKNTEFVWGELKMQTTENTRNIDKILSKFEMIMMTKNIHAENKIIQ